MPECYADGPRLRRPFLITSYVPGPDGVPSAVLPARCPQGTGPGGATCAISVDHLRRRKTGPDHPLAVARCRGHRCAFTLYPPGYAPYRRQQVLKIAPDETRISTDEEGLRGEFSDTVFAAAVDGASGRAWARDSHDAVPDRWWSTQGRHLRLTTRLVGIARDLGDRVRESIAAALSVSGLRQREHSRAKGYRAIGAAVCDLLQRLRGGCASRAFALLVCGHLTGHWGEPIRWDPVREDIDRSPFCRQGTTRDT